MTVADNLHSVTRRIAISCEKSGRPVTSVSLVCVTKEAPPDRIREAIAAGARILGENRVQDALRKHAEIGDAAAWHLIGHLQTNKAADAVHFASLIHSVDSLRLAQAIHTAALRAGKVQDILVQVNVSGEASKFGIGPGDVRELLDGIAALPCVSVTGLMTIAPLVDDPEKVRPVFRALRELRDTLNAGRQPQDALRHLSMGMTGDFEVAVEEGATLVRVGRAIFS